MSHFSTTTRNRLARKGITLRGLQAIPDAAGSYLNSVTGYLVNDNGCGRVWTFQQVREAAR